MPAQYVNDSHIFKTLSPAKTGSRWWPHIFRGVASLCLNSHLSNCWPLIGDSTLAVFLGLSFFKPVPETFSIGWPQQRSLFLLFIYFILAHQLSYSPIFPLKYSVIICPPNFTGYCPLSFTVFTLCIIISFYIILSIDQYHCSKIYSIT